MVLKFTFFHQFNELFLGHIKTTRRKLKLTELDVT